MSTTTNRDDRLEVQTFCRVCEPACGMVAEVEGGELVKLRPDRSNPLTRGFVCNKGIAGVDIHNDPDRVDFPLRRTADGTFERVSWDDAIAEIAERLRGIVDRHGSNALARYVGNPTAFNTLARPAVAGFFGQLDARRAFSSGTQDCANKFSGSEAVFGSSTMHPIPDLAHTDFFLSFGANPRVSHGSFLSIAHPVRVMCDVVSRGGRVVHVNPRQIETAETKAGETLLIRPDTDVYLLAALLCEIDRIGGFDESVVAEHGKRVEELRAFISQYPAERVAASTGIEAETIRQLARDFSSAPAASVHMSTGVNMGRDGTLAYWLLHMLSFVTGNLDRRGGNILSVGFYASAKAGRRRFEESFQDSEFGPLRKGTLPGNLLPDYVELAEDPIRAMIVIAGNPVLSIGGEERLRSAMEKLELLVVVDLYRNATAEYADFILPSTDTFERADINITGLGLQYEPGVQYTDAVVEPRGERREEWWILGRLAQALGLKSPFDHDDPEAGLWGRIDHMLRSQGLGLDELRQQKQIVLDGLTPGSFYAEQIQTEDGRVDCCPPSFADALDRCAQRLDELDAEGPDRLKMITRRDPFMHNSWYANLDRMKRGDRDRNYLFVRADDAEARGVVEGQLVRLHNEWGEIEVEVRIDDALMRGTVALTHGWGNQRTPGMRVAARTPGVNQNVLLPSGEGSFDPLSSQAFMTGIPVEISAA